MKILLIGSGGREHALAWRLTQSPLCGKLYCAPGNAGIAQVAECVPIGVEDVPALVKFAKDNGISFVVVGPEAALVAGVADPMREAGIKVFGPSKSAAILEGSKAFMKDLFAKYKIPTAAYGRFKDISAAKEFIRKQGAPIVVKTDGLAAGKGVIIAQTVAEAEKAAEEMLSGTAFGAAGNEIVIEEFLEGEEVSFFALADGKSVVPLASAQDHKRVGDGDTGPNTGGMGAYSPAGIITPELHKKIMERIIRPTVAGMAAEGRPFTGVLYAGLMIDKGEPKTLEYNVRFGDPECQPVMMRLKTDLAALLLAAAEGRLAEFDGKLEWSADPAICVVMAAKGYPGSYQKNTVVQGLDAAAKQPRAKVFHAGTVAGKNGEILANGGRVLGICAAGATVKEAQQNAYRAVDQVQWPEGFCRRDIGWRAVAADEAA